MVDVEEWQFQLKRQQCWVKTGKWQMLVPNQPPDTPMQKFSPMIFSMYFPTIPNFTIFAYEIRKNPPVSARFLTARPSRVPPQSATQLRARATQSCRSAGRGRCGSASSSRMWGTTLDEDLSCLWATLVGPGTWYPKSLEIIDSSSTVIYGMYA